MRSGLRNTLAALVLVALVPMLAFSKGQSSPARRATPPKLFKDGRQMLAIARAQNRDDITLLVAARPGAATRLAGRAEALDGDVRYLDDEVDYLRVRLPLANATAFSELDDVESVTTDVTAGDPTRLGARTAERRRRFDSPPAESADPATGAATGTAPRGQGGAAAPQQQWPPRGWGEYPLDNPYRPLTDIDGVSLRDSNPSFDGRGVTIALLDGNFDLLLSEFQTAYALDGTPVPKVADFVNTTDPRDDAGEMPQWVDMKAVAEARGGRLRHDGKTFTAPRDGAFRIGLFNERAFNDPANAAYIDQDVDRNGNPRGDDGLFGVLWDETANVVWVDTDRDLDFADEEALTDYFERPVIGVFGEDDPDTPDRESIGFAVQTDSVNKFVAINLGIYQHATGIMGSVVGNLEPNGRVEGVAPGARLASFFYGVGVAHGLIEGLIAAFRHPQVDLIVLEQSVFIASIPYSLADGRHPMSIIAQRLIDRYDKLVFVPGGNSPGFAIVGEDGLAPGAVSVGGYQSQSSYRANLGFVPAGYDHMHWGGRAHGPAGNGALKPDLLAPSGQIGTEVGYVWRAAIQEKPGLFTLPPGYAIDGGTSTATPMAAGAAALVVSAAKQNGIPYGARRLKAALVGSARHLPGLPEYAQGNGLVQVEAGYRLLEAMATTEPVTIVGRAPVRTRLSGLMATPHEGTGLYEREGWSVGDRGRRSMTFTRTSGPDEPMTFAVVWRGDTDSFRSPASIELPRGQPVELPIEIMLDRAGAHSAAVTFEHPSLPGPAYRGLATVVAPLRFEADNEYRVSVDVEVPRPADRSVFVDVPAGVGALSVSMTSDVGGVRVAVVSPSREHSYPCGFAPATPMPCAIVDPEPGVWELNATLDAELRAFEPRRDEPLEPGTVTVTASIVGVGVDVATAPDQADDSGQATLRSGDDVPLRFTNLLAPVNAGAVTAHLASTSTTTASIGQGEQHVYEIEVPSGATSLRVEVDRLTAPNADLDLYLLDCSNENAEPPAPPAERDLGNKTPPKAPPSCVPRGKAATIDAGGAIEIADPAAGRWVAVVDGYLVADPGAGYRYRDAFTHPTLGTLAVADHPSARTTGDVWRAAGHVWSPAPARGDRGLSARIVVTTEAFLTADGRPAVIGAAAVEIELGERTAEPWQRESPE